VEGKRVDNVLTKIMEKFLLVIRAILGAMMIVGVFLNLANVIGRYVFLKPIIWAEEILTYGMVWVVMLGATLVTWRGSHLKMDAIYDLMPSTLKRFINALINLTLLALSGFVVVQSYTFVSFLARVDQRSVAAEIPMALVHGSVLVGFSFVILVVLTRFRVLVMEDRGILAQVEAEIGTEDLIPDAPIRPLEESPVENR
jgi:TRAP-type C4-dicarboxylate transport system permease small subunit